VELSIDPATALYATLQQQSGEKTLIMIRSPAASEQRRQRRTRLLLGSGDDNCYQRYPEERHYLDSLRISIETMPNQLSCKKVTSAVKRDKST
jgi:hypothetical protein